MDMEKRSVVPPFATPAVLLAALIALAGCASPRAPSPGNASSSPASTPGIARLVLLHANVVTMDDAQPVAQAIAIDANGKIIKVGNTFEVLRLATRLTQRIDATGWTILPGFIDPHSHMAGYAMFTDTDHWLDVSSINVYFKPAPGTPACLTPTDPQHCFIPVKNQGEVVSRLRAAVAKARLNTPPTPVLAFNYDPSRLGHDPSCLTKPKSLSFECTTFENGKAIEQLDAISTDVPIYVTSESGHISYVNTPALAILNICQTPGSANDGSCHKPAMNANVEIALANMGQLDEDLSLYATGVFQGQVLKANPGLGAKLLQKGAEIYAQHGYTLAQEGAAGLGEMGLYLEATRNCKRPSCPFPLSAAMIAYDNNSPDFAKTIAMGEAGKAMFRDNPLVSVPALKTFADGSLQGYTGYLKSPYSNVFPPFTFGGLFPQPYVGLPDVPQPELALRLRAAHAAGYPMIIHQIGDAAISGAVDAVVSTQDAPPPPGKRDTMLHVAMISGRDLDRLKAVGTTAVSVMSSNVYFYGLPECQMVLDPQRIINVYPARSVVERGLPMTLHSDSPVEPPYPLFEIWVAATRNVQQPSWYPNRNASNCPARFYGDPNVPGDERISILDGIKAFTTNAAIQYGFTDRGAIKEGYIGDLVLLSDNPLDPRMAADPDLLKTIRTMGTVSYGQYFPNPTASQPPVWPAD
jgi:predicted amidohydrolase YtcJ